MDIQQLVSLRDELAEFLDEFRECFVRAEPRLHMASYVRGQLQNLDRKSVEPMALAARLAPRTLQEFLRTDVWDHEGLRDRAQRMVARDHSARDGIVIVDDSGHPKKGTKTACVSRQYCGRTGKLDNCVVSVHLAFASWDTQFRVLLDSIPYLPESWDKPELRQKAHIPDSVVYRPKYDIALEELDRARANGVQFGWVAADSWYGQKRSFLAGLVQRGERFVVEIPQNFCGWTYDPRLHPGHAAKPVQNLAWHSRRLKDQLWQNVHVKDTQKGPEVWKVRWVPFWCEVGGVIQGPWWLLWTRNERHPQDEKFVLSNASAGTPLEAILHAEFARWLVERCLEDEKSELGLSHFEVRNFQSLCRHLLLTNISHLFAARQVERLRGEKSGDHHPSNPGRHRRGHRRAFAPAGRATAAARTVSRNPRLPPPTKRACSSVSHQDQNATLD